MRDRVRALQRNGLVPRVGERPGTSTIQAAEGVPVADVELQHPRLDPRVDDGVPFAPIQEEEPVATGAPPTTMANDPAEPSGKVCEAEATDVGRSA